MTQAQIAARPSVGDELELRIESLAHGGRGVARSGGYVLFVQGAIPGDRVRARVVKRKRSYGEARVSELLKPAPDRIEPRAEHPGAPWQVLPYQRQLEEKQAQVVDALERIGGFEQVPVEPIVPAVEQWRYRNKVEYSFGRAPDGRLVLGFHPPGSWRQVVAIDEDVLASPVVNALRARVRDWCEQEGLTAYDRETHAGFLRNLVVREGRRTGQLQVRLVTSAGDFRAAHFAEVADAHSVVWSKTATLAEVTRDAQSRILSGAEAIEERIGSLRFRISLDAFFQTNTEMAERLYAVVADFAGVTGSERVFDLFCGIGTIGLSLAGHAREVWGVEIVEYAVADAIANAELNGIENARFFAGDIRTAARPLVEQAGTPDVVVVDPPRAGLSQRIIRRVAEMKPRRIVYVSCNPTTLAPNARQLADAGWNLERVQPVDMFPQTPHIECVALLEQ